MVTIYDKSVEYISGGSNVPDIKEFFWKWQRSHNINTESSLQKPVEYQLYRNNEIRMGNLGTFGASLADEEAYGLGSKKIIRLRPVHQRPSRRTRGCRH